MNFGRLGTGCFCTHCIGGEFDCSLCTVYSLWSLCAVCSLWSLCTVRSAHSPCSLCSLCTARSAHSLYSACCACRRALWLGACKLPAPKWRPLVARPDKDEHRGGGEKREICTRTHSLAYLRLRDQRLKLFSSLLRAAGWLAVWLLLLPPASCCRSCAGRPLDREPASFPPPSAGPPSCRPAPGAPNGEAAPRAARCSSLAIAARLHSLSTGPAQMGRLLNLTTKKACREEPLRCN